MHIHRFMLFAGLALAIPVAADELIVLPAAPTQTGRTLTLGDVDQGLLQLRQIPLKMLEDLGNPAAEPGGRRLEDDIAEYILTQPVQSRIAALRGGIHAGEGEKIPVEQLQPLQKILVVETCRVAVVSTYWQHRRSNQRHSELVGHVINLLVEDARPAATRELRALEARGTTLRSFLAGSVERCEDWGEPSEPDSGATMPMVSANGGALLDDYNTLRLRLMAQGDMSLRFTGADRKVTARSTPCPAPAPPRDGNATPALRSRPDIAGYYPAEAMRSSISGVVRVGLHHDSTGCVLEAVITQSSGSDLLDAATLRFALDVALLPGVVDGKPLEGMVILPVRFGSP